jgi:hypothetical protein
MESVLQESLQPWLSYSEPLRLTFSVSLSLSFLSLSLSLSLRKVSLLETWGKKLQALYSFKAGNPRNLGQLGAYTGLPMLWGQS